MPTPACEPSTGPIWATEVVSFAVGTGVSPAYGDPATALGAPDWKAGVGAVSLGNPTPEGGLVLGFGGHALVDGPGDDLRIVVVGPATEPAEVALSEDGVTWVVWGTVPGGRRTLDLAGPVPAGRRWAFVRLRAKAPSPGEADWAGPDLDAVGFLHACRAERTVTRAAPSGSLRAG